MSEDIWSYSRTRRRQLRRHRVAAPPGFRPETFWSIQFRPSADGTPGEIDLRIHAQTEALAWEAFIGDSPISLAGYERMGFRAVQVPVKP